MAITKRIQTAEESPVHDFKWHWSNARNIDWIAF